MSSHLPPFGLRSVLITLACLVVLATTSPVEAGTRGKARVRTTSVTFRLHVTGPADARATFWVAYGPLAGQWGVIRMRSARSGNYLATRPLPVDGQAVFTFLQGQGTMRTQMGVVPGNPVTTIRTIGPVTAVQASRATVEWQAPAG